MEITSKPYIPVDKKRLAAQQHQKAQEALHHLVVKIINWKTGTPTNKSDKITPSEWTKYKKHVHMVYQSESPAKIKERIQSTQQLIQKNHGFA